MRKKLSFKTILASLSGFLIFFTLSGSEVFASVFSTSESLECNYRSYDQFDPQNGTNKFYPRIKKAGDTYILTYHGSFNDNGDIYKGTNGAYVWYATSKDLKHWTNPQVIWQPVFYTDPADLTKKDCTLFTNCDMVVLDDGSILAVCAYRSLRHRIHHPELNGLIMKKGRLTANGQISWEIQSDDSSGMTENGKIIHLGKQIMKGCAVPWEPHIMQSGNDVVVTYTESQRINALAGFTHSPSSTAVIVSHDRGSTWSEPRILTQKFIGQYTGALMDNPDKQKTVNYYTSQMPVGVPMNDGRSFFVYELWALNQEYGLQEGYSIGTSIYEAGYDFEQASGISAADVRANSVQEEPALDDPQKQWDYSGHDQPLTTLLTGAAAPYALQFPSGEIVVSFNAGDYMYNAVLNHNHAKAGSPYTANPIPVLQGAFWGSILCRDNNDLISVFPTEDQSAIEYKTVHLNHSYQAEEGSPVIDGNLSDWSRIRESLFVGSESQAQTEVRFCQDEDHISILFVYSDRLKEQADQTEMILQGSNGRRYVIRLSDGEAVCPLLSAESKNSVWPAGPGETTVTELSIPRSELGDCRSFRVFVSLTNSDDGEIITDTFSNASADRPSTWPVIFLGNAN